MDCRRTTAQDARSQSKEVGWTFVHGSTKPALTGWLFCVRLGKGPEEGTTMKTILVALCLCVAAQSASLYRIACGSSTGGTDSTGKVWQSDAYFTGGSDYSRINMIPLGFPYRALRTGTSFGYTFTVPNGNVLVKLHFLEIRSSSSTPPITAGQRRMSVSVAGSSLVQIVGAPLDVYAVAGSMMPYAITVPVNVLSGKVDVNMGIYDGSLGAILSGIEIDSVDSPPDTTTYVPYVTGLEATPPACPATGLTVLYTTDTSHLFWCFEGSSWHWVGDVTALPKLLALDACSGSGTTTLPDGRVVNTDCAGVYRAQIQRADGTVMPLNGSSFAIPASTATWTPVK